MRGHVQVAVAVKVHVHDYDHDHVNENAASRWSPTSERFRGLTWLLAPGCDRHRCQTRCDCPRLDAEVAFIFGSDAEVVEEGRSLRVAGVDTTFTVTGLGAGCSLRLTKPARAAGYDEVEEGWVTFVEQLRFALERHPGEERRTVYLPATAGAAPATFAPLAREAIGARYELVAAEKIAGEVWFASELQLGLTVEEAGDGLLMLAQTPQSATSSAILTTYGLDDDAFEWLRARWTAWWKAG